MVYSRSRFYFRKYAYIYTLILLILFISLQIYQYSNKCRKTISEDDIRVMSMESKRLIVVKGAAHKGSLRVFLKEFNHLSSKNSYFALAYRFLLVFYRTWFSLEYLDGNRAIKVAYYNSIKQAKIISPTSRVIEQLKCNFRLINGYKRPIYMRSGSAFKLVQAFSRLQKNNNEYIHQLFDTELTPDQSALASGTLIGSQTTISKDLKNDLINGGLIHVVVASGYNLMIVASWVYTVLSIFLPKRFVLFLSLGSIWWYAFLALFNPSIVRAAWMCSLSILAIILGRPKSVWRTMAISILLLLALEPVLAGNISFQLSVLATIGVLSVNQRSFEPDYAQEPTGLVSKVLAVFKENCQTTIGANLMTLPIILFWFKRISVISVVSNTLLLWLIPLLMYCSSVYVIVVHIHPVLGAIALIPIRVISNTFLFGAHLFGRFPYASVELRYISLVEMVLLYVCIFIAFYFRNRWKKRRK